MKHFVQYHKKEENGDQTLVMRWCKKSEPIHGSHFFLTVNIRYIVFFLFQVYYHNHETKKNQTKQA